MVAQPVYIINDTCGRQRQKSKMWYVISDQLWGVDTFLDVEVQLETYLTFKHMKVKARSV